MRLEQRGGGTHSRRGAIDGVRGAKLGIQEAVLVAVITGVSFQPQWLQAKSSWGLGLVANSPQRGHFIVHMVDLPVMVR